MILVMDSDSDLESRSDSLLHGNMPMARKIRDMKLEAAKAAS